MPVVFREVDVEAVKQVLYGRGYGPAAGGNFALTFNKPTGRVFSTGSAERKPLPGVTERQLTQILRFADDAVDAANRIEKIMLGGAMVDEVSPAVNAEAQVSGTGLSPGDVEALVSSRVSSEVSRLLGAHVEQVSGWLSEVRKEIVDLRRDVEKLKGSQPKKGGRPMGSKNRPKAVDDPLPALTTAKFDAEGEANHF